MAYWQKYRDLKSDLRNSGPEATKERVDLLNQLAYGLRVSEQWDRMQTLATEAATLAHEHRGRARRRHGARR